ncbi:PIN domain-containing protein [Microbacterium sp. 2FI]|uniref:type II toxin-antitoxin system VapC family toxin n=1 Tax=Microbacterium sp. 2FI TaxID=2502193 RepID=UPI0010F8F9F3|nr:PIN domain-containing protein [Microbacterium sp. 2FI]
MIYVDTCLAIYAIEDPGPRGSRARALFRNPVMPFAFSPLVMMEALVAPIRSHDDPVIEAYHRLFTGWDMVAVDLDAYMRAAELRAASPGLKTVDALHLAAAELAGCEELWTNDRRLAAASAGLAVDVIGTS